MASTIGKSVCITSTKGGVGKTTFLLTLAGVLNNLKKKVLIIDFDLYNGGIGVSLNKKIDRDIFFMTDDLNNNRYTEFKNYVTKYNDFIDFLPAPKDPRQASKFDSKYIDIIISKAETLYDIVLIDTTHILNEVNLILLDRCYVNLFIINNDIVNLKSMKSLISILKDTEKTNYKVILNNASDINKEYLTIFDIKNVINANIDYTISNNFYIKTIDKYVLDGTILSLSKNIQFFHGSDLARFKMIANDIIDGKILKGVK